MKKGNITLAVICALIVGAIAGIMIDRSQVVRHSGSTKGGDKLSHTLDILEKQYVDSISRDSLAELVVPILLNQLDPHSEYIPASDLAKTNEPLVGKFDGIGVVFNMATDTAKVLNVVSGGPSSKSGIVAGDRIITINDTIVAGVKMDQMKVVGKLRGQKGTTVRLGIQRGENKTLLPFTITRGEIPINSLEASYITDEKAAYIRLSRFSATTYNEVMTAIAKLTKQGAKSIIFDLRGNGGGYFDQAVYLANEFLPKNAMIVYIQGAHRKREEQRASGNGRLQSIPLTILVDETTASSSEIFAGAMQDNDRATIIGRRTFGKGLIQDQIDYPDGSAARITIARYYTPLGRPLQKPYKPGDKEGYRSELIERYSHNEFLSADSVHKDTLNIFHTPKGRTLYGGGGIMPDLFVPLDTAAVSKYFGRIFQKNLVFKFAQSQVDRYRQQINAIETLSDLDLFFAGKPNLYQEFIAYSVREAVAPTAKDIEDNRKVITAQLKAYIGSNTQLQESAFFYYIQPLDNVMIKARSL